MTYAKASLSLVLVHGCRLSARHPDANRPDSRHSRWHADGIFVLPPVELRVQPLSCDAPHRPLPQPAPTLHHAQAVPCSTALQCGCVPQHTGGHTTAAASSCTASSTCHSQFASGLPAIDTITLIAVLEWMPWLQHSAALIHQPDAATHAALHR